MCSCISLHSPHQIVTCATFTLPNVVEISDWGESRDVTTFDRNAIRALRYLKAYKPPNLIAMSDEEEVPDLVENVGLSAEDPDVAEEHLGTRNESAYKQVEASDDTENSDKVPITIVTGFLGSGKSTLLNHILTSNHGKRIAVILNEFGDSSDIERSLSVSNESELCEEWLDLKNGCMCCTLKDNAVSAIENLMRQKGKFDYILLETTGLADPGPIANMFWLDDALLSSIYLDGVITLVDAANLEKSLDDTARLQISMADVVVMNKLDRVQDSKQDEVEDVIRSINSIAKLIKTTYAKIELDQILDLRAYDSKSIQIEQVETRNRIAHHDHEITTITIPMPALRSDRIDSFESAIQKLLWNSNEEGIEILRMKGRVMSREGRSWIIQGVRDIYEMVEVKHEQGKDSKLIFIGKQLSKLPVLLCSVLLE